MEMRSAGRVVPARNGQNDQSRLPPTSVSSPCRAMAICFILATRAVSSPSMYNEPS